MDHCGEVELAMEAMVYGKFSVWREEIRLAHKPYLVPVFKRSNLSSLSVYCPSFMTDLRRTTLAELVVLSSHYSTKPYDELSV